MNKIYAIVWNAQQGALVAVSELTRARGKSGSQVRGALLAGVLLGMTAPPAAFGAAPLLPTGAQVTAGHASISSSGSALTVQQSSATTAINWQTFNIGSGATVNFRQPDASAVVLNRVIGGEQSVIDGALNANGQVFLLNSSGVLFTRHAQVSVGGLVASTLNLSDADFLAGKRDFGSGSGSGRVVNLGSLSAAVGGYIALLGHQVSNGGVIRAQLGSAALAAGDRVSLNFNGNSLLGVSIDVGTLGALVENSQAILADGGQVILSAQGLDTVLASAVNNTGEIRAQTIANQAGHILLLGGMQAGMVNLGGTLDASAPHGGNGGSIETSAAHVKVADNARISTQAPAGQNGNWLIDPQDFTIAAGSGGDISGSTLSTALASGSVTLQAGASATSCTPVALGCGAGSSGSGSGSIYVNDAVSWSADTQLTLQAQGNIYINNVITNTSTGTSNVKLALQYGQASTNGYGAGVFFGTDSRGGFAGQVNLTAGQNLSMKAGSSGTTDVYTVITSVGSITDFVSAGVYTLAGLENGSNMGGNFALGADITINPFLLGPSAPAWSSLNPIGSVSAPFTGKFNGLGHTITNAPVQVSENDNVGLFGYNAGTISNLILNQASILGTNNVGAIAGYNSGTISAVAVINSTINGNASNVGGLVGNMAAGSLTNSYGRANSVIAGSPYGYDIGQEFGGLVGYWADPRNVSLANSFYDLSTTTLTVYNPALLGAANLDRSAQVTAGGIYDGANHNGQFSAWIAGGRVALNPVNYFGASQSIGGQNYYLLSSAQNLQDMLMFAAGGIPGAQGFALGANLDLASLPGWHLPYLNSALLGQGYSLSNLSNLQPYNTYQGLIGYANGSAISGLRVSGTVAGYQTVGGVAGSAYLATFSNDSANDSVSAQANDAGGLVGTLSSGSSVSNSHATGSVRGVDMIGGLVGYALSQSGDAVTYSDASGAVSGYSSVGGLVGYAGASVLIDHDSASGAVNANDTVGGLLGLSSATITHSTASGNVSGIQSAVGGLVGNNAGWGGSVASSSATGSVQGGSDVGGLVGFNSAAVSASSSSAQVSAGAQNAGGLVG